MSNQEEIIKEMVADLRYEELARRTLQDLLDAMILWELQDEWKEFFKENDIKNYSSLLAILLARSNLTPDDLWGQRIADHSPLTVLNSYGAFKVLSRAEQAAILYVATLKWAGAIPGDRKSIQDLSPELDYDLVNMLLMFCDFESFWLRPGVGKTKEIIYQEYESGEFPEITKEQYLAMIRKLRAKKG